jgi:hypothetical protein
MAIATLQYNTSPNTNFSSAEKTMVFYVGVYCMCVSVISNNSIELLQKYNYKNAAELNTIIQSIQVLHEKYKKIKIAYGFEQTALTPNQFYHNNSKEILQTLFDFNENTHKNFADTCDTIKAELMYSVPKDVLRVMISNFPVNDSCHFQTTTIQQYAAPQHSTIVLYCLEDMYCVAIWSRKKLLVSKTITVQSHSLLCYNLLALAQMYNIVVNTAEFMLSGWVTIESALYKELYKYFDNIYFLPNNSLTINEQSFENHFTGFVNNIYNS